MIVVVGLPAYADSPDCDKCAGGLAVEVAAAARRRGRDVELVGKVGEDGAGDAVVVALGRLGIGHAALLRDPLRPTPVLAATAAGADYSAELDSDEPLPVMLPENAAERPSLDAADIDLALRYLPQSTVIVVAEMLAEGAVGVAVDAAAFGGAKLVVVVAAGTPLPQVPAEATVLEAPGDDDGSFGRMVGIFAAALDSGVEAAAAFREAVASAGWESAST